MDFLRGAVERYGSRDALLFKPAFRYQRWSYSRLWNESGQVATLLQRRGLTMGDQVILWGPNSPHWVLIFFGCIRAGVVLVPLDLRSAPDYGLIGKMTQPVFSRLMGSPVPVDDRLEDGDVIPFGTEVRGPPSRTHRR